jgi:hypothetical protein
MNFEQAREIVEKALYAHEKRHMSDAELTVLQGSWDGLTYEEMAKDSSYGANYLKGDVGHKFWQILSKAFDGKVSKSNFKAALERSLKQKWSVSVVNSSNTNPFGKEGRINNPEDFFDREEILDQIFEALNKGGNRTIVGEKQIGKSSILSMVCNLGLERLKFTPESFVYLDMRTIYDENDFFDALCSELGIETCRGFQLARKLRNKRYIFCLDTFEKQREECFRSDMWSELRGLADGDSAPFKLVIASRSPLNKLLADYSGKTSPLDDICREINVEPFSPDVARDFLKHRLRDTDISFTESEINQLIEETKVHPARLQQAAANLYRSLESEINRLIEKTKGHPTNLQKAG